MERITQKDLENRVQRLNELKGYPIEPYTQDVNGKHRANANNYHLSGAYGGVKLVQMCETGGCRDISTGGYGTKRELYNIINSMINVIKD